MTPTACTCFHLWARNSSTLSREAASRRAQAKSSRSWSSPTRSPYGDLRHAARARRGQGTCVHVHVPLVSEGLRACQMLPSRPRTYTYRSSVRGPTAAAGRDRIKPCRCRIRSIVCSDGTTRPRSAPLSSSSLIRVDPTADAPGASPPPALLPPARPAAGSTGADASDPLAQPTPRRGDARPAVHRSSETLLPRRRPQPRQHRITRPGPRPGAAPPQTTRPVPIPAPPARTPHGDDRPEWPITITVAHHLADDCRASPDGGHS
jgi:hypothetical protein